MSRSRRQPEIVRPDNPCPPSSSSASGARSNNPRSTSSSASLVQNLLKRSPRYLGNERNHLPSDIYVIQREEEKDANSDDMYDMSPLMLPQSSFKPKRGILTNGSVSRSLLSMPRQDRAPPTCRQQQRYQQQPSRISIADYELHGLLQSAVASLQVQHQNIQSSLTDLDKKTKTQKSELLRTLAIGGGDAKDPSFAAAVEKLEPLRAERVQLVKDFEEVSRVLTLRRDKLEELATLHSLPCPPSPMPPPSSETITSELEGQWFTLTKPTYLDCLGFNDDGNPMYTLGRMSFEMFRPGNLVVSLEAVFNPMEQVAASIDGSEKDQFSVPKTMQKEVQRILENTTANGGDPKAVLRTYHIVTAFVIEPYSPSFGPSSSSTNSIVRSPIRGIMTTYGYALPDPENPDRLSIWFSGGKVECGESRRSPKFKVWKRIFGTAGATSGGGGGTSSKRKQRQSPQKRTVREGVMVVAARLLMGAKGYNDEMDEESGEMGYTFSRPMGGHGKAYVDIVHLDEQTRVMRGHAGTLYVFTRVGGKKK